MLYDYYYNDVPGQGLCRNNLIYTSLANRNLTRFVQWYYNDGEYHKGQNQVVNSNLMDEKFKREVRYLQLMSKHYPNLVPKFNLDIENKKIYLEID